MGRRYSLVSQCIQLLKQSDLPVINKLQIELLLIKIKRLLLDEPRQARLAEGVLDGLLSQMRRIHEDSEAVAEVMNRVTGVVATLSGAEV